MCYISLHPEACASKAVNVTARHQQIDTNANQITPLTTNKESNHPNPTPKPQTNPRDLEITIRHFY